MADADLDITVAICTYRRTEVLRDALESLAAADGPGGGERWEVLVVDNACDPDVEAIVMSFDGRLPIRYAKEQRTGIAKARNRAVEEARGRVVLFADDDVTFDRRWLARMSAAIREHSECRFWGGRIVPKWDCPQPTWFDMERCPMLGDSIVRYDLGEQPRAWVGGKDPPFYSCSLAIDRATIREMGMFDESMGHVGKRRGTGEDSWMVMSIAGAGGKGWYAGDAVLEHPVPADRVSKGYARRFAWRQGRISVEMQRRLEAGEGQTYGRTPRWWYRVALGQMMRGMGVLVGGIARLDSARAFAGQMQAIFNLSKLVHAMRRSGGA